MALKKEENQEKGKERENSPCLVGPKREGISHLFYFPLFSNKESRKETSWERTRENEIETKLKSAREFPLHLADGNKKEK